MKLSPVIIIIVALAAAPGGKLKAQEPGNPKFNTNQRISDQLKNGTAPGLKFGPKAKQSVIVSRPTEAEKAGSIKTQLKNGNVPGMNVARGGSGSARSLSNNSKMRSSASGKLPSESNAAVLKPSPVAQPKTPDQGDEKAATLKSAGDPKIRAEMSRKSKQEAAPAPVVTPVKQ